MSILCHGWPAVIVNIIYNSQETVNCLSVLLSIHHPIVEPLLPSLLSQLAQLAYSDVSYAIIYQAVNMLMLYFVVDDEVD